MHALSYCCALCLVFSHVSFCATVSAANLQGSRDQICVSGVQRAITEEQSELLAQCHQASTNV